MSDQRLRDLERRWKASMDPADERAYARALVEAGRLLPDEVVGLSFAESSRRTVLEDVHDNTYVEGALTFRAPGRESVIRAGCRAGSGTSGPWDAPFGEWCTAHLYRRGELYAVRLELAESNARTFSDDRQVLLYGSNDGGASWEETPEPPFPLEGCEPLAKAELRV